MSRPIIALLVLAALGPAFGQPLPAPVVTSTSFETASNSRYSVHSGFSGALPDTVLSNILWAMTRAPSLGSSFRDLYIATADNVYRYDSATHSLSVHLAGNHRYSSNSAFEIGVAVERDDQAGPAIQAGLLAGAAFWQPGSGLVTGCPMAFAANHANSNWNPDDSIRMVNVHGRRAGTGLTDSCVAVSSDSSLPRPAVTGTDSLELLLADLAQDSVFDPAMPPFEQVSQLLWAGFGVTPHMSANGRRGTTVPSAIANYYLTRRVYLVADTAVFRYHNRLPPGTGLTTSDHRIELLTSGDRRDSLRRALPQLPQNAPLYVVLCVGDTANGWHTIEAGFVAFQYLVQARALGLGGNIAAALTTAERNAVQSALGLPAADFPYIVFSGGGLLTGVEEPRPAPATPPRVRAAGVRPARIEYSLPVAATVEFRVSDLAGRTVRRWTEQRAAGKNVSEWPGTDAAGQKSPAGAYLVQLRTGGWTGSARIVLPR